jgi:hypothetical protein
MAMHRLSQLPGGHVNASGNMHLTLCMSCTYGTWRNQAWQARLFIIYILFITYILFIVLYLYPCLYSMNLRRNQAWHAPSREGCAAPRRAAATGRSGRGGLAFDRNENNTR